MLEIPKPRETWYITNISKFSLTISDLPSLPVLKPGDRINLLDFTTVSLVTNSATLAGYIKNGLIDIEAYLHAHDDKADAGHEHEDTGTGEAGTSGTSGTSGDSGSTGTS